MIAECRPPSRQERIADIDVLRGVAIVLVLAAHSHVAFPWDARFIADVMRRVHLGQFGVMLFFVVSGYIIARSLVPQLVPRWRRRVVWAFYVRRFWRIFPLSTAWVAITLLGTYYCNRRGYFGVAEVNAEAAIYVLANLANLKMTPAFGTLGAFGVYWSLAIEEQFYLVFPLAVLLLGWPRLVWWLVGGLVVLLVMSRPMTTETRALWFDGLMLGIIVYRLSLVPWLAITRPWHRSACFAALAMAIASVGLIVPAAKRDLLMSAMPLMAAAVVAPFALGATFDALGRHAKELLVWIGIRAYGLYLSHFTVSMFTREGWDLAAHRIGFELGWQLWLPVLLSWLGLTFLVSEVLHRLLERPLIDYGRSASRAILKAPAPFAERPGRAST